MVWLFRCFLAKSNLALFAPCGEPSVFALVKYSLDCRLWQWLVYLLESVFLLAGCCEKVFLYHGEVHNSPQLWSSMDIQSILCCWAQQCFFFSECTKLLIWPLLCSYYLSNGVCFWCLTIVCFSCMEIFFDCMMWVQSNSFQIQMAHLESTLDILPA